MRSATARAMRYGSYGGWILSARIFFLFLLALSGCSAAVKEGWRYEYVPISKESKVDPVDPFNVTSSKYADCSQVILHRLREDSRTKGINIPTADEEMRYNLAVKSLAELVSENHAPSLHLAGLLLTEGSAGNPVLPLIPASSPSDSPAQMRKKGITFLSLSARMGYPESIALLKKLKQPVPKRDMQPPPVEIVQYELRKVSGESAPAPKSKSETGTDVINTIGEIVEGLLKTAVIAAAVVVAAYGQAEAQALHQRDEDLSGCCSWHGGIDFDLFGNRRCDFLARVMCKDGTPSVSCRCY